MLFVKGLPVWSNAGTDPGASKKAAGWLANEKPPAEWFNWLQNTGYLAMKELQDLAYLYVTDTGSANAMAIAITEVAALTQLIGVPITIATGNANTSAVTLTVNALAATAIVKNGNTALATGDIVANSLIRVIYDGTNFHLVSGNQLFPSLLTAAGDMFYASAAGVLTRLAKGPALQCIRMKSDGNIPEWGSSVITGAFSDTATSVNASSDVTKTIPLGIAGTSGRLRMLGHVSTNYAYVDVIFTTSTDDALIITGSVGATPLIKSGYGSAHAAYANALFANQNPGIILKSVRINGTDLEVILTNTYSGGALTLLITKAFWEVW
jgi:hypothetical protein